MLCDQRKSRSWVWIHATFKLSQGKHKCNKNPRMVKGVGSFWFYKCFYNTLKQSQSILELKWSNIRIFDFLAKGQKLHYKHIFILPYGFLAFKWSIAAICLLSHILARRFKLFYPIFQPSARVASTENAWCQECACMYLD